MSLKLKLYEKTSYGRFFASDRSNRLQTLGFIEPVTVCIDGLYIVLSGSCWVALTAQGLIDAVTEPMRVNVWADGFILPPGETVKTIAAMNAAKTTLQVFVADRQVCTLVCDASRLSLHVVYGLPGDERFTFEASGSWLEGQV